MTLEPDEINVTKILDDMNHYDIGIYIGTLEKLKKDNDTYEKLD